MSRPPVAGRRDGWQAAALPLALSGRCGHNSFAVALSCCSRRSSRASPKPLKRRVTAQVLRPRLRRRGITGWRVVSGGRGSGPPLTQLFGFLLEKKCRELHRLKAHASSHPHLGGDLLRRFNVRGASGTRRRSVQLTSVGRPPPDGARKRASISANSCCAPKQPPDTARRGVSKSTKAQLQGSSRDASHLTKSSTFRSLRAFCSRNCSAPQKIVQPTSPPLLTLGACCRASRPTESMPVSRRYGRGSVDVTALRNHS